MSRLVGVYIIGRSLMENEYQVSEQKSELHILLLQFPFILSPR